MAKSKKKSLLIRLAQLDGPCLMPRASPATHIKFVPFFFASIPKSHPSFFFMYIMNFP
jgi:hypothetical protein